MLLLQVKHIVSRGNVFECACTGRLEVAHGVPSLLYMLKLKRNMKVEALLCAWSLQFLESVLRPKLGPIAERQPCVCQCECSLPDSKGPSYRHLIFVLSVLCGCLTAALAWSLCRAPRTTGSLLHHEAGASPRRKGRGVVKMYPRTESGCILQ